MAKGTVVCFLLNVFNLGTFGTYSTLAGKNVSLLKVFAKIQKLKEKFYEHLNDSNYFFKNVFAFNNLLKSKIWQDGSF